ncbi:hypothetical protein [Sporichthya sp.]|uniref:hypothetical protein n=1 Tax=Sporichthya sp. TaxID=65475 RepID=UPI0018034B70|nr:hypothetical protein [Sporichthya sp.]MBA3745023.1 hypothetical protein [Sporichthya sp.]
MSSAAHTTDVIRSDSGIADRLWISPEAKSRWGDHSLYEPRTWLKEAGWTVIRTTWEELVHYPEALVERIRSAIAACAPVSTCLHCG